MDNRTHILDSALNLFASKGYDAIGVQEIVQTAGVTKPTLYYYFGSKRGILEAIVAERLKPLIEQLKNTAVYRGDLPLHLTNVVKTYFAFATQEPVILNMQLAMWHNFPENEAFQVISPVLIEQHQIIEQMFEQAAKDHGNMQGRHQAYAASLLGTINAYISLAIYTKQKLDEKTVAQVTHQFSHGIYS